jgi:hypothetical protein
MDHREIGCGVMDWTGLAQDRDRWMGLAATELVKQFKFTLTAVGYFYLTLRHTSGPARFQSEVIFKSTRIHENVSSPLKIMWSG